MNNIKEKIAKLFERIKNNKRLQFLLLGLLIAVILLVYITYFIIGTNEEKLDVANKMFNTSTEEYVSALENKLSCVLKNIEGVENVSVAITVSSGFVNQYAYEEISKDSLSSTSISSSIITIDDEPIIISQTYPEISGVLVVAEGANNIGVKLSILEAVQTLLEVANENITILDGDF